MGAPLADVDTLAGWLGFPPFDQESAEGIRAVNVIDVISKAARGEARQPTWTLATVPENVSAIVLMVAAEAFTNPDNKTSVTIEEVTRRWQAGELFSKSQTTTLQSFRPGNSGGLSSVQFTRGLDSVPVTTPVEGGSPVRLYDGRGY